MFQIVTAHIHNITNISNVVLTEKVLVGYLTSELPKNNVWRVIENEVYLNLDVAAAMLQMISQFLKPALKNAALLS